MSACEDRANRKGGRSITPSIERHLLGIDSEAASMHASTRGLAARGPRGLAILTSIALAVAACGGGTSATTSPAAPTKAPATTAVPTSAVATPAPTSPVRHVTVAAMTPEAPLSLLWSKAGPTPKAGATSALAVAPDGRVFAVSALDDVIWIFKPDGTFIKSIGGPGKAPGQFDFSDGHNVQNAYGYVAFAPDGAFFVADTGNSRVQAFDKDGKLIKVIGGFGTLAGQFAQPVGIALDSAGNIYVGDNSRNDVQKLNRDGTALMDFHDGIDYTNSQAAMVAVDPSGNVFTTVTKSLVELAPDATETAVFDLSAYGYPSGLIFDSEGNLWIGTDSLATNGATPGPLVEMDARGIVLNVWSVPGDLVAPDPSGKAIYVSFFEQANVHKFALPAP